MTRYSPGDVALVRFPFTDLTAAKRRPVVVVSPAEYAAHRGDVVVLALTSQPQRDDALRLGQWSAARLPKPTWVKPVLGTLAVELLERRLGTVAKEDEPQIVAALRSALAPKFWK
jgi:mRNA interferase MazF